MNRSQLKNTLNQRLFQKLAVLTDVNALLNAGVKAFNAEHDFRGAKRRTRLAPNLFGEIYDYACPVDLKDYQIIDVINQIQTGYNSRKTEDMWNLVPVEEFDRRKQSDPWLICVAESDVRRNLRISAPVQDRQVLISTLDSLTAGGGTWAVADSASNLSVDGDDFVNGNASLRFDITGTTASIENSTLTSSDITLWLNSGSVFAWVMIPQVLSGMSVVVRLGSDASNCYQLTATTTNEGTAFAAGWNLVRFDLANSVKVGSPVSASITYAKISVVSSATSVVGCHFDWLCVKKGWYFDLLYYSAYPWKTVGSVWLEDSANDTDTLNFDSGEIPALVEFMVNYMGQAVQEWAAADRADKKSQKMIMDIKTSQPSEALIETGRYFINEDYGDGPYGNWNRR